MSLRIQGLCVDLELVEEESKDIGGLRDALAEAGAPAVTCGGTRAQQDGESGSRRRLKARGHFA